MDGQHFSLLDVLVFLLSLCGFGAAIAVSVELQNTGVVYESVDGCGCRDLVFEYVAPLGEWQIARNHQAPLFVAFGNQQEQDVGFIAVLWDV